MTGISTAMQHMAGMLRGSKLKKVGGFKQLVRRVSSAGKGAFNKGKVASKVAKKNKELMTPLGMRRIGETHLDAASRRIIGNNNSIHTQKGIPSRDSLHRLRRLGMNAALGAEAKGSRNRVLAGAGILGAGGLGYKLGKKKNKSK